MYYKWTGHHCSTTISAQIMLAFNLLPEKQKLIVQQQFQLESRDVRHQRCETADTLNSFMYRLALASSGFLKQ